MIVSALVQAYQATTRMVFNMLPNTGSLLSAFKTMINTRVL